MERRTIVFDISSHGFGHLSQTGPVIDGLHALRPDLKLLVRTRHPPEVVAQFVSSAVELCAPPPEPTMIAPDAATIDLEASARAFRRLQADWERLVAQEAQRLRRPLGLLSNINPTSLAAARRLGAPAIALCCLNWLEVYRHYFSQRPEAAFVSATLSEAYSGADVFLQPRPHLPMRELRNARSIGPICRIGRDRRDELRRALRLRDDEKILLLTLGGFALPEALDLPIIEGAHWVMRGRPPAERRDLHSLDGSGLSVLDATFSADAVVCKDSYCTVVEAVCAGAGVVMVPRPDWPETTGLIEWASRRGNVSLAPEGLDHPRALRDCVLSVLGRPPRAPTRPEGVEEAVEAVARAWGLCSLVFERRLAMRWLSVTIFGVVLLVPEFPVGPLQEGPTSGNGGQACGSSHLSRKRAARERAH
jgi:hypothetical protein